VLIACSLLASGKYSDLVITCGGDTHKVHKAVVCTRSGFFERAERFAVAQVCQHCNSGYLFVATDKATGP
jgi:hypothetical protein